MHCRPYCSFIISRASRYFSLVLFGFTIVVFNVTPPAYGADVLAPGSYDVRATGRVTPADTAARGSYFGGLKLQMSERVAPTSLLGDEPTYHEQDKELLRDAHRGSIYFGMALTDRLELNLGLHGTYEHVPSVVRGHLGSPGVGGDNEGPHKNGVKQSAFSGASLMLKTQLVSWRGLRLGLAPFIESGAGERATYSLTRSVGPKAGFMALASYGDRGVATLDINAGMRYRDPEKLAELSLRNESFYGAAVNAYMNRSVSLFAAAQGRSLKVARAHEAYRPRHAAEASMGVKASLEDLEVAAFYGQRISGEESFGYGEQVAGLSVAIELGNVHGRMPKSRYAEDVAREAKRAHTAKQASGVIDDKQVPERDYSEMNPEQLDPIKLVGDPPEGDDFTRAEEHVRSDKGAKGPSSDEKVEQELAAIRAAEAKAEAERLAEERKEDAVRRREAQRRAKEEEKLMREWMQEARQEANELEGITHDEMYWNGLE